MNTSCNFARQYFRVGSSLLLSECDFFRFAAGGAAFCCDFLFCAEGGGDWDPLPG